LFPRTTAKAGHGFTLLELVLWTAIAAMVAALGAGLVAPFAHERKLRAAAERVAAALEYGRDVARHERRPVAIRIASNAAASQRNSVSLAYADSGSAVHHPLDRERYRIDLATDAHLQGVEITTSSAGGDDTMTFDSAGAPVDLNARFVLRYRNTHATVQVEPYSGRVVIADGGHHAQIIEEPLIR
jgi:Tfp pilus assembly protein FimT